MRRGEIVHRDAQLSLRKHSANTNTQTYINMQARKRQPVHHPTPTNFPQEGRALKENDTIRGKHDCVSPISLPSHPTDYAQRTSQWQHCRQTAIVRTGVMLFIRRRAEQYFNNTSAYAQMYRPRARSAIPRVSPEHAFLTISEDRISHEKRKAREVCFACAPCPHSHESQ